MILKVKIKANARKNEISIDESGTIKIKVSAPALEGRANKELINYLSKLFEVSKSGIEIVSGETSPHKRIEISGDERKLKEILDHSLKNQK